MQMLISQSNACNYKNKGKWRSEREGDSVTEMYNRFMANRLLKEVQEKRSKATNLPMETFAESVPANHAAAAVDSAKPT